MLKSKASLFSFLQETAVIEKKSLYGGTREEAVLAII